MRKFKVVKSANLSDLNSPDKKNILKFVSSKFDNDSIKAKAAQILAELKKKKQNDDRQNLQKDKNKSRNPYPKRSQNERREDIMTSGHKRSYQEFQRDAYEDQPQNFKRVKNDSYAYEQSSIQRNNQEFNQNFVDDFQRNLMFNEAHRNHRSLPPDIGLQNQQFAIIQHPFQQRADLGMLPRNPVDYNNMQIQTRYLNAMQMYQNKLPVALQNLSDMGSLSVYQNLSQNLEGMQPQHMMSQYGTHCDDHKRDHPGYLMRKARKD